MSVATLAATQRSNGRRNWLSAALVALLFLTWTSSPRVRADDKPELPSLTEVRIASSLDGTQQPTLYWAPDSADKQPTPLLVFLHSWSGNYKQKNDTWQQEAINRGWIYLHPDFRGRNDTPEACGSKLARQDILDAIDFARKKFQLDSQRVYLAGTSGGGHMSMLMAGHHPDRFSAVSAWVGISDIAEWYRFHLKDGVPQNYAKMILKSLGGPPDENSDRDADYRDRSPIFHLSQVGDLPIDLSAGIRDGHTGSVPVSHTLHAWNRIATAKRGEPVSTTTIQHLYRLGGQSEQLKQMLADLDRAPSLGRKIILRSEVDSSRVTIFDGGHEGIASAACEWLSQQQRTSR